MLYYLLEDYLSPFKCMVTVFEQSVLENYWLCCAYWHGHVWLMNQTAHQCGTDVVESVHEMVEFINPSMPSLVDKCAHASPGGMLTCAMWHPLNMVILALVGLVCLWAVLVTVLWCRAVKLSHTVTRTNDRQSMRKLIPNCVRVELQPLKPKNEIVPDENSNHE